ncbi:Fungal specific transcription factor domain-containing protein [Cladophialophora immunda]|nr:Fungal specific transcription factor domain-containing protein [Cladophialophora immunda]
MSKRLSEDNVAIEESLPPRRKRIRACEECKKQKIKCEVKPDGASCARCNRIGLTCVRTRRTVEIIDADTRHWRAEILAEIRDLREATQQLLQHNNLEQLAPVRVQTPPSPDIVGRLRDSAATADFASMDMTRENSQEAQPEHNGLIPDPMRSLYDLTKIRNLRNSDFAPANGAPIQGDFISEGAISQEQATALFNRFKERHDALMWGGALFAQPLETLDDVRKTSPLLTASILAIAALHTPGQTEQLNKCYAVFVSLARSQSMSRHQSRDDVRALCLAAFFMPGLSWTLSGLAVRVATQINLHQSYTKFIRGQPDQRECVRLWYALYICDHHSSIAYGRPPMTPDDPAILNVERFVQHQATTPEDVRLGAQVALFTILTKAYHLYGWDPEEPLEEKDFELLRMFNFEIDQWRLSWQAKVIDVPGIGSYPSKGIVLYYHFARFQLNSLAFRAIVKLASGSGHWNLASFNRREAANLAITAAISTLSFISEEPDLRNALAGVPVFTHTMVAFCATFLLKIALEWYNGGKPQAHSISPSWTDAIGVIGISFDFGRVLSVTRRCADMLGEVSREVSEKHLARHISLGLQKMTQHLEVREDWRVSKDDAQHFRPALYSRGDGRRLDIPREGDPAQPATTPADSLSQAMIADGGGGPRDSWLDSDQLYDAVGSFGFGFDESLWGQSAEYDFEYQF